MKSLKYLFLLLAVSAKCGVANEYWISTNATGLFVRGGMGGTLEHPLDGSTVSNFDFNMSKMPPNSVIHLLAGTYQTKGNLGWTMKSGQKITGSGMDITILQFPSSYIASLTNVRAPVITMVLASYNYPSNMLVADMTVDCNYQPGAFCTLGGVHLTGSYNTIDRVKLKNAASHTMFSTNYQECFGFIVGNSSFGSGAINDTIENCDVEGFTENWHNNMSAIGLTADNSKVLNNTIVQYGTNHVFAIGIIGKDDLMSGNICLNDILGFHSDTRGGTTNLTIITNKFINTASALFIVNSYTKNLTFAYNTVILSNNYSTYPNAAFDFYAGAGAITNLVVVGNRIFKNSVNSTPYVVSACNLTGLIVKQNQIDSSLTNSFRTGCSNIVFQDNYDLFGKPSPLNNRTNGTAAGN
jgi:hypothetical protein